jgi:uncharacterized protein YukE
MGQVKTKAALWRNASNHFQGKQKKWLPHSKAIRAALRAGKKIRVLRDLLMETQERFVLVQRAFPFNFASRFML